MFVKLLEPLVVKQYQPGTGDRFMLLDKFFHLEYTYLPLDEHIHGSLTSVGVDTR